MRLPLVFLLLAARAIIVHAELFPVIVFTFQDPGPNELAYSPETDVPTVFQYRITDAGQKPGPSWYSDDDQENSRLPWFDDTQVLPKLGTQPVNCHTYVSQGTVPIKRSSTSGVENVRLEPVPTQQLWSNNLLKTNAPGLPLNRLSSCCEPSQCPRVCLQNDKAVSGHLEILAPQWGYDQTRVVTIRAAYGGAYESYGSRGDPGVWPVYRVPCDFCPVKSCTTACTNGQFASDYAVFSAVSLPDTSLHGSSYLGMTLAGRPSEKQRRVQAVRARDVEHMRCRGNAGLPMVFLMSIISIQCTEG